MPNRIGLHSLGRGVVLCVCALLLASPAFSEELGIPGSGNPEYVLGELANAFNASQSRHHIVVPPSSGTAGAVRDVSEGIAMVGRVGRPLKEAELAKGLTYVPVGLDAIAIVGGAEVTARGVTSAQLKAIFAGNINDWSMLSGKPGPIRVIGKEASDAIRQRIDQRVGALAYGDAVKIVHLDPQLIELRDRYPTSFVTMNRSALGACKTRAVTLALDGVEPSLENLEAGRYPLSMEFGLIHGQRGLGAAGQAFLEFIRSPEGVNILHAHAVLPLNKAP